MALGRVDGKYRDLRPRLLGAVTANLGELASRFTGSSDLYQDDGRRPSASVNFVTCHDGFTLADLVSYNEKHNEANGEDGGDGSDDNRSWNCGVEGPTADPGVLALRERQQRNFLATLFLSQGVPMLLGGDELGRTQGGNNNAWCQDNEISWFDWELDRQQERLLEFTRRLIGLRRRHPLLHRAHFFAGRTVNGSGLPDIWWFRPDGRRMAQGDWQGNAPTLGVFLNGDEIPDRTTDGGHIADDSFLVLFNAGAAATTFRLPSARFGRTWVVELSTVDPEAEPASHRYGQQSSSSPDLCSCSRRAPGSARRRRGARCLRYAPARGTSAST